MKKTILTSTLVALVVSALVCIGLPSINTTNVTSATYSASDKITQTGKIRVGYINVAGGFNIDPKTKEMSGIFHDIIEEMAKNMGLQLEYVEEVGWGTMIAGLQTKRYDMMASPVWPNSNRAKQASFSNPAYYSAIGIWVRQNENRFTREGSWASINQPDVRIGVFDGSTGEKIAQTQFADAKIVSYPEGAGEGQIFLDLISGKVDVFFEEPAKGVLFVRNNPNKIKNIAAEHPVKVFSNVFLLPAGDYRLKEMIDTALAEVENSGFVEKTIRKYEPVPNTYYRVALPYRTK